MKNVCISVVTYNSSRFLATLADSILRQTFDLNNVSIVFVDNGSSDNTLEDLDTITQRLNTSGCTTRIIINKQNLGFGKAHNLAQEEETSEFVLILNPDCELHTKTIEMLVERATHAPLSVAAFEPRQLPYEHPKVYDPVSGDTDWVSGACVLIRRSVWSEVKGFDPRFFLYGEDVDISWRIKDRGYSLCYVPKAILYHYTYEDDAQIKPAQFFGSVRANLLLRTRFGTYSNIAMGLARQLYLAFSPEIVPGQRRAILKNLGYWVVNFFYFRSKASRQRFRPKFWGWNYARRREGAFVDASLAVKNEAMPLVSIVTRTLGKHSLVRNAIQSVQNQTYRNLELILVEDGSSKLKDIQSEFEKLRIKYIPLIERKGRCEAGNIGVKNAEGKYICFLDEDDLLYADHVEQLVYAAQSNNSKVTYSYAFELPSHINEKDEVIEEGFLISRHLPTFDLARLVRENYFPINTVLFDKELFLAIGGIDTDLEYNEDWDLWLRMALRERPFIALPKTTAIYRVPLRPEVLEDRQAKLDECYRKAREKHKTLPISSTLGELFQEPVLITAPLGLEGQLVARFPRYATVIRLLGILRRLFYKVRFKTVSVKNLLFRKDALN